MSSRPHQTGLLLSRPPARHAEWSARRSRSRSNRRRVGWQRMRSQAARREAQSACRIYMRGPNRVPGSLPAVTELASSTVAIDASPLLPGTRPIELSYRDVGRGAPIVLLHGGWGYAFYPHDDAIAKLERRFVIPDRTGYGGSPHVTELPPKFHLAAAIETEKLLNALAIERPVLWGHSDGAIIATILALRAPDRYDGIIVEAIHLDRAKPHSRDFFLQMVDDPDSFGERVTRRLAQEHGEDYWRTIIRAGGPAWIAIAPTP